MGSDCYEVSVHTYREHTTEEAQRRLGAYGFPPDEGFFSGDGPWIEIRLDVRCVHPDAPIGWGPTLVIRWLDEAVYRSARTDGSGYDFGKTPLAEHYPGLWGMGFSGVDREDQSVVRIVEVEFRKNPNPREGRASDPYGDTATIAAFIHKRYAPNIAGTGYWESRAWGGTGYFARDYPVNRPPIPAEIRPITPSAHLAPERNSEYSCLAPRREGGIWAAKSTQLLAVTAEGGGRAEPVIEVLAKLRMGDLRLLAAQADGTLWGASLTDVIRRDPAGGERVFRKGKELDCKKIQHLAVSPDGQVYVGADTGLLCLGAGDVWTLVKDGLAERAVHHVTALAGGVAWIAGQKHLTRRNADGSLERFQSRQGVENAHRTVALPGGGAWAYGWWQSPVYIAPGAGRALPDATCARVMPLGLRAAAVGPDGAVWCATQRGYLARLREGEVPKVYVWDGAPADLWSNIIDVCVSFEGDVWLRTGRGVLFAVRAQDLAAADAGPPLNAGMPHLARLAPFSFGPATEVQAAPAIDFRGKTVVITGTLSKLTRDEAQRALSERGALLSDSVSKKTHYLIVGLRPSSKLQKAKSLGIPVLDEDVLLAPAAGAGGAPAEAKEQDAKSAQAAPVSGAEGQDAKSAQAAAGVVSTARFPLADQAAGATQHLDAAMMRRMAESKPEVTVKEWKALVKKHKAFLDAGGGNGKWHVLEVSGLLLAALEGYKPDAGEQASLYLRRLPAGFDARKARLAWMNGCGMLAEGVDFCGANLQKSVMSDAFLAGARFDAADLSGVDFSRTDLRGASFREAALAGADFEGCDLTGADFTGARVEEARFPGAKLGGVKV